MSGIKAVADYFTKGEDGKTLEGDSLSKFGAEWKELSDTDKEQLKQGIENGTLTY